MSTTPVPITSVAVASAAPATDPVSDAVGRMKAEIGENPDDAGSPSVQTVIMYENYQQNQQTGSVVAAIAAAFKPPPPAQTPLEGLGYAAAQLTYALQAPFADLQKQLNGVSERVDGLATQLVQLQLLVDTHFKQVDLNISRQMTTIREEMKELKELKEIQRAQDQVVAQNGARLATLERVHKNTAHHVKLLQTAVGKLRESVGASMEGWEEMVKGLERHISEMEREQHHEDPRRRR